MNDYREIYKKLKDKFSENFNSSIDLYNDILEEVEIKNKSFYCFGEILAKKSSKTHEEIAYILNEIFSDLTVSTYLVLSSINNPAKILLRRVLELGIAVIYFWDLPHKYWGWKNINHYATDLQFKNNIDHINSDSYKEYLKNEHGIKESIIDKENIDIIYRDLSNTIHGKYETFESNIASSFSFNRDELNKNLLLIIKCQNILLKSYSKRFVNEYKELKNTKIPGLERYSL